VIEFYPSSEAAEAELAEILGDEPGWRDRFEIVIVDFGLAEPVVRRLSQTRGG
jgi:hypothetical protein